MRGKPLSKNVFTVVRADSVTSHTTATTTEANYGFHHWNEKFAVELGPHAKSLTFEVKCKNGTGARDVGVARIALSDFLGGLVPDHCLQFLCYRLRDWDGRENGILNFSVRVVAPPLIEGDGEWKVKGRGESECWSAAAAAASSKGVVTGIPVWWNKSACSTSNVW